jgi:HEPN domain-containing protein
LKQATRDWLDKAEGDYTVAARELGTSDPVFDAVCFHAQQCVEKYLKGVLQEFRVRFPRTHDLVELAVLASPLLPSLTSHTADLKLLTAAAVDLRYPGASAGQSDAEAAFKIATDLRRLLRAALGL